MSEAQLQLILKALDQTKPGFDSAAKNAEKTGSVFSTMGKVAAVGFAGVAGGVAAIGAKALDVSGDIKQMTNMLQTQLGLDKDAAKELGDTAVDVFKNNFGGSIAEAGDALAIVATQMQDVADSGPLQTITENAFQLKDAFGVEVAESVDAVKTLMQNFGITSDQAFDMLTAGYQRGLDRSGDFLESVGEYSTQFAAGGATAQQFFSVLESGMQGGVLGTDKAADAFKEFRVRILDGSTATADGLKQLGINADEFTAALSNGSITGAEAFETVLQKLREAPDEATRMQAGVALIGTQFEDLGTKGSLALTTTSTSFDDVTGKAKALDVQYENLGSVVESYKRRALVALAPVGDKLLELANDQLPKVEAGFSKAADFVEKVWPSIVRAVDDVKNAVRPLVDEGLVYLEEKSRGLVAWFNENWPDIQKAVERVVAVVMALWKQFGDDILAIIQNRFDLVKGVIESVVKILGGVITLIVALINGDWAKAWDSLKTIAEGAITLVRTIIESQIKLVLIILGGLGEAAKDATKAIGTALYNAGRDLIQGLIDGIESKVESVKNKLGEVTKLIPDWKGPPEKDRKLLASAGANIMQGLIDAIDAQIPKLQAKLEQVTGIIGAASGGIAAAMNEMMSADVAVANAAVPSGGFSGPGPGAVGAPPPGSPAPDYSDPSTAVPTGYTDQFENIGGVLVFRGHSRGLGKLPAGYTDPAVIMRQRAEELAAAYAMGAAEFEEAVALAMKNRIKKGGFGGLSFGAA